MAEAILRATLLIAVTEYEQSIMSQYLHGGAKVSFNGTSKNAESRHSCNAIWIAASGLILSWRGGLGGFLRYPYLAFYFTTKPHKL